MIKISLIKANPLSIQPMIALKKGMFEKYGLEVTVKLNEKLSPFYIEDTTANVGDITRIFEHIYNGTDMIVTSDLTRTMKLIVCDDYNKKDKLRLSFSPNQSLGIYSEAYLSKNRIEYENIESNSIAHRKGLMTSNLLDGACMIDPFLNEFIGNGYRVLFDGNDFKDNYTCWAFRKEYVVKNKQNVINFHKALNEAGQYFNNLSGEEKIGIAYELLDIDECLEDYYSKFEFIEDREYSFNALQNAYNWKITKDEHLRDMDITNIILKWDE